MSAEPREAGHIRVRTYPDEILRRLAAPVGRNEFGEEFDLLVRSMIRTMYDEEGVGLAAPQVGASLRLVVMYPAIVKSMPEGSEALVLVNPVIVDASGREIGDEGCLSVPGVNAKVGRRAKVTVEYEDPAGQRTGIELDGLAARVAQHEIDHLDGTLFVDRLSPAGRLAVKRALRDLEERAQARS